MWRYTNFKRLLTKEGFFLTFKSLVTIFVIMPMSDTGSLQTLLSRYGARVSEDEKRLGQGVVCTRTPSRPYFHLRSRAGDTGLSDRKRKVVRVRLEIKYVDSTVHGNIMTWDEILWRHRKTVPFPRPPHIPPAHTTKLWELGKSAAYLFQTQYFSTAHKQFSCHVYFSCYESSKLS